MWDDWDPNHPECISDRKCKGGIPEPTIYNSLGDGLNQLTAKYLTELADHTTNNPELVGILTEAEVGFSTEQEKENTGESFLLCFQSHYLLRTGLHENLMWNWDVAIVPKAC